MANDGNELTVRCIEKASAPAEAEWGAGDVLVARSSSCNNPDGGGGIGFTYGVLCADNLTMRSDQDGDGDEGPSCAARCRLAEQGTRRLRR